MTQSQVKLLFNLLSLLIASLMLDVTIFEVITLRWFNWTGLAVVCLELWVLLFPFNLLRNVVVRRFR